MSFDSTHYLLDEICMIDQVDHQGVFNPFVCYRCQNEITQQDYLNGDAKLFIFKKTIPIQIEQNEEGEEEIKELSPSSDREFVYLSRGIHTTLKCIDGFNVHVQHLTHQKIKYLTDIRRNISPEEDLQFLRSNHSSKLSIVREYVNCASFQIYAILPDLDHVHPFPKIKDNNLWLDAILLDRIAVAMTTSAIVRIPMQIGSILMMKMELFTYPYMKGNFCSQIQFNVFQNGKTLSGQQQTQMLTDAMNYTSKDFFTRKTPALKLQYEICAHIHESNIDSINTTNEKLTCWKLIIYFQYSQDTILNILIETVKNFLLRGNCVCGDEFFTYDQFLDITQSSTATPALLYELTLQQTQDKCHREWSKHKLDFLADVELFQTLVKNACMQRSVRVTTPVDSTEPTGVIYGNAFYEDEINKHMQFNFNTQTLFNTTITSVDENRHTQYDKLCTRYIITENKERIYCFQPNLNSNNNNNNKQECIGYQIPFMVPEDDSSTLQLWKEEVENCGWSEIEIGTVTRILNINPPEQSIK